MSEFRFALKKVEFQPDGGVVIDFILSPDAKDNGLFMSRSLRVPGALHWDDEIDAVYDAVSALLFDAMEDLTTSTPVDVDDEDDDEAGGLGE